ncbi:copper resistance system multicopper oxidase [Phaeobacter gallaeciensis]|uniref:copper resistance system multicopper oxidase n=1 Tax=Phaeobacter TaxID=302485 RepID=UPI00237F6CD4|nr:copper resistance system multicopper oxidase [Phaeobacter gallaeciensis]MDE4193473.1 copper resistance system multicopper oxidase [Phaeobacter gallaeciensis]MDE4201801.1 copper resistance system multicopper oxidase [Phaeobacter gallaeciensis]MDE4205920.1 copper resistance system multicopper oxidase [Phaeobacter gallaeciensis]MDE4210091.1 copper resistance system multicopper oxidase [Phaeobacter gallaeciensis]MDE4218459.1 copper resistance system multicopper oxidase [Phaeobacter gallaeciensi
MRLFNASFLARSDTALSTSEHLSGSLSRRQFGLAAAAALAMPSALQAHQNPTITSKGTYDITVDRVRIDTGDFRKTGVGYNNSQFPTVLRFKEGEEVTINVKNNLNETTSIHWHGLILPFTQDGVPGISFNGIPPGETFTYRFPITQAGTYWFHSHSGFQEPDGAYGAIVIEPRGGERVRADRDYVVQLADNHPHSGRKIMRNLKRMPDYYNRSQRTLQTLVKDSRADSLQAALQERGMWGRMRMMPTDIEDVQGFTASINGWSTSQNWTGLFRAGEKVRLRFINASAMTYFDMRIPGLKMTVVQADGNDVKPVTVDELRIAVAETYDVIVQPRENKAYSIIAESVGRTGMVRGTLAPREGMAGAVPAMRSKPLLTMADMGGMMGGMDHSNMAGMDHSNMAGMDHSNMAGMDHSNMAGMDHSNMGGRSEPSSVDPSYANGSGLIPRAYNGGKFLSYADLTAARPKYKYRKPSRTIELRLTGNMERYIWSINDVKFNDAEPIVLKYGERVRIRFINETMMAHPMHLHGLWSLVDMGKGSRNPIKHTVNVNPAMTVDIDVEVDEPGQWAFHCHLSYHADAGMFRKVVVRGRPA